MPVAIHAYEHFLPPPGDPPGVPQAVTSITSDAGARVSFRAPASQGGGPITAYVITPYIGGAAQSPTTVAVGSLGSITGSDTLVYRQADVAGLANGTAYTFRVAARNAYGDSPASDASGENTPLAGLVFGDDFNGGAGGPIDPEHWLLDVAATVDEDDAYRPDHVSLDGAGHLVLLSTGDPYRGKPYTSGCIQNNTRSFFPAAGNTLTFETRAQVCPEAGGGMWPAPWCMGTFYQERFKTNQDDSLGRDNDTMAEIDYAEWIMTGNTAFQTNTWAGDLQSYTYNAGLNTSAAQHIYRVDYKPSVRTRFFFDGAQIYEQTAQKPIGAFFHMWFQQIQAGSSPSFPQRTYVDYLRIYDRNLG